MRQRGYTLPLVILVLGTLAAAMTLIVVTLGASAKTTGSMLGRRQTLAACDGMVRALMVKSRGYFAETATPTAPGLRDFLCDPATAPLCPAIDPWFTDYVIEEVTTSTGSTDVIEEVPTGPFRGQMARRTDISLSVTAKKLATSQRCRVTQNAINSEIGLFQFAVFSAMSIELRDPPPMDIRGRVHINGDFEAGGSNPLTIEKVTAAGKITAFSSGFSIRDAPLPNTPLALTSSNDSNSAGWRVNSENTWHGNAQDVAWGVPMLRLPVATTAAVQRGRDANGAARSNSGMLRVLVDPPRALDDDATAAERIANKAKIRIINGVWYENDGTFPGVPIWSDHPAPYIVHEAAEAAFVGASTLDKVPVSSAGPQRYSNYETDFAGNLANNPLKPSVVSYGPLAKVGAGWAVGRKNDADLLGSIVAATTAFEVLDGTRSGFIDGRVQKDVVNGGANIGVDKGRILPLNFNVGAFVEALKDTTTAGELGSHFPTGLGDDAIVWIANTWSGWDAGFPNGDAQNHPVLKSSVLAELTDIPQPLCGGTGVFAGSINKVACSASMTAPNAVRIWNAAMIDPAVLPRGLTIVTNGPMYLLGDTNTASLDTSTSPPAPGVPRHEAATGPWVPMMIGGDAVTLLSNSWDDNARIWGRSPIANTYVGLCAPDTAKTTYVMALLGGHVEVTATNGSGGVQNFPRFLECWRGIEAVIHGSLVAGYRSVYQDQGFSLGPYRPPNRTWKFDPNLAKPANQPPGTPSFFVSAIERWQRD